MKQKINKELSLFFRDSFPRKYAISCSHTIKKYKYYVTLGIGGNIGNTIIIFHKLLRMLQSSRLFYLISTSPILENPPFGYEKQDSFYNAVLNLYTNIPPKELLKIMQRYENRFKRKRSFKNAPRTLDIDIIFIKVAKKDIYINTNDLIVPHPFFQRRLSVLIPLLYL